MARVRAAKIPFVGAGPRSSPELARATANGSAGPSTEAVALRHRDGNHLDRGDTALIVADALATEYGYREQPLNPDQRTLGEFC
ncbi:hypothetical protein [Halopiger aswanensis]|uniref:Uncharacterized protein n=1 Tax=Halopiger aswanensis TaxID=148449 RepID=A0A3R7DBZ3_9EURY|nr:hypothetical protein [Halopiger aswanensis]RKD97648.1 hypothetical protein ATJ93_0638 [Halopiger aswanensis]